MERSQFDLPCSSSDEEVMSLKVLDADHENVTRIGVQRRNGGGVSGNVHVTGITGGAAKNVTAVGILHGNIMVRSDYHLKSLQEKTLKEIKEWTTNMLRPSSVDEVLKRINHQQRWITVTGNAGEGKTTVAYMTLKELADNNKKVFKIDTPEDYYSVVRKVPDSFIMMNDVLGAFAFDPSALSRWESVFHHFFDTNAKKTRDKKPGPGFVIFISRLNVVEGARPALGIYEKDMFGKDKIINLSRHDKHSKWERHQFLDYYLQRAGMVNFPLDDKEQIASGACPHGFPHCCKLFADLMQKGKKHIDIKRFFENPLLFLNQTVNVLIEKQHINTLFKEMLKNDGFVVLNTILDDVRREEVKRATDELLGSYLTRKEEKVVFAHPSIHESVALSIGQRDPLFAVQHFNVSFILQKVKFTTGRESLSEENLNIESTDTVIKHLCRRFIPDILRKDFSILQHDVCKREDICKLLIESSVEEKGIIKRLKGLFSKKDTAKINIDSRDENGDTLLHVAHSNNNQTAIETLLKLGADVNVRDEHFPKVGNSFFHLVLMDTSVGVSTVQNLVRHGAAVNQSFSDGETVINYVYKSDNQELFQYLLDKGADVNVHDATGMTLLHHMCEDGASVDDVKLLIKYGANVNKSKVYLTHFQERIFGDDAPDFDFSMSDDEDSVISVVSQFARLARGKGKTALHFLCSSSDDDRGEVMEILISHGARVNKVDKKGRAPLQYACENDDLEIVNLLINHGANVNVVDSGGNTAVHQMFESNNVEGVQMLLKSGADVNMYNNEGKTILHSHCQNDTIDLDFLQLLISYGADVNSRRKRKHSLRHELFEDDSDTLRTVAEHITLSVKGRGKTALHYLCRRYDCNIVSAVKLLLQNRAKADLTDQKGNTPLYYACITKNWEAFEMLLQQGCNVNKVNDEGDTVFHFIGRNERIERLKTLLKYGADVNKEVGNGKTLLHYACQSGTTAFTLVECLVQAGADVNKPRKYTSPLMKSVLEHDDVLSGISTEVGRSMKRGGKAPLHYACMQSKLDVNIIELLLRHGASVNRVDRHGMTPLHYLVSNSHSDVNTLWLFISHGADVSAVNNLGQTTLHLSCRSNVDKRMFELLVQNGVDIDKTDKEGKRAFDYLAQSDTDESTREMLGPF